MPIQMRLSVWMFETFCQALLLGALLIATSLHNGLDQKGIISDLIFAVCCVMTAMFLTGYLLTTMLCRIFENSRRLWLCPAISSGLFSIHFEVLNLAVGGAFERPDRILLRVLGPCFAFVCTVTGSFILRRWIKAREHVAKS